MASQPGADHGILHASDTAGLQQLQQQQQQHNHHYSNTNHHHPLRGDHCHQQQVQASTAAPTVPAGHSSFHAVRQHQSQQASGAPAAAAELATAQFAAGMPLRMLEQKSGSSLRWTTGAVYDFTCMGCLGRSGDADVNLVELTRITLPTNPSAAVAAAGEQMPAAPRMFAAVPAPSLQVGSLYALKVSRHSSLTQECSPTQQQHASSCRRLPATCTTSTCAMWLCSAARMWCTALGMAQR
jgi:hypothetical protein